MPGVSFATTLDTAAFARARRPGFFADLISGTDREAAPFVAARFITAFVELVAGRFDAAPLVDFDLPAAAFAAAARVGLDPFAADFVAELAFGAAAFDFAAVFDGFFAAAVLLVAAFAGFFAGALVFAFTVSPRFELDLVTLIAYRGMTNRKSRGGTNR